MKNKIILSTSFFFVLGIFSLFFLPAQAENYRANSRCLPTYFTYSVSEIQKLERLSSKISISEEQLKKWDRLSQSWITEHKVPYFTYLRFYTYLYAAQRDASFLSYNVHDHFEGTLDPVSFAIAKLFFPDFKRPQNFQSDPYSEELANVVFEKYKSRFERENSLSFEYKVVGEGGYKLPVPKWIANCAKWIPWFVRPINIYLPPPPPEQNNTKAWSKEILDLKAAQKNLSEKQKQAVYFWAGLTGQGSGDWRIIANQFLFQNNVPMAKAILVRSVLTMSLYDTAIAYLNAKYHYGVMRPSVRDPSVKTMVAIPPHPSYPSGHSTEGTIFKIILTYYFPDEKNRWDALAEEAGMSRIWGGIHYPADHRTGQILGTTVGDIILNKLRDQEHECQETKVGRYENAAVQAK